MHQPFAPVLCLAGGAYLRRMPRKVFSLEESSGAFSGVASTDDMAGEVFAAVGTMCKLGELEECFVEEARWQVWVKGGKPRSVSGTCLWLWRREEGGIRQETGQGRSHVDQDVPDFEANENAKDWEERTKVGARR